MLPEQISPLFQNNVFAKEWIGVVENLLFGEAFHFISGGFY
jgi:hypothetical protein